MLLSRRPANLVSRTSHHALGALTLPTGSRFKSDYIHESKIPTMHFQNSLVRLPVPKLEKTLPKYLDVIQPIVSEEQFAKTQAAVKAFETDAGPRLQSKLEAFDKANKHTSYIAGLWYAMYLDSRAPLPLNFNPYLGWKDDPNPERMGKENLHLRASSIIASSVRFMKTLEASKLEPDVFHTKPEKTQTPLFTNVVKMLPTAVSAYPCYALGAYPLDMSQYARLFKSTRIPRRGSDELKSWKDSKHVVVVHKNKFYSIDVIRDDGSAIPQEDIAFSLKQLLDTAKDDDTPALGALTTEDRDVWADLREKFIQSDNNRQELEKLDSALFTLVLDSENPTDMAVSSQQFLHGDGRNRWFDKSFSVIMMPDGRASVNFEHAWGDGVAVLRYFNEVFKDATQRPVSVSGQGPPPQQLNFEFSPEIKDAISSAEKKFDETVNKLDLFCHIVEGFGKDYFKENKLSPDGAVQQSFQLAYWRMFGKRVSTYESASTSAFKHGRTETIRVCTNDSANFVQTIQDPAATKEAKIEAFKKAVATHSDISRQALMGLGVDRHLFALKDLAAKEGSDNMPDIFTDAAYSTMNHNTLSTSTLSSEYIGLGGFGPVTDDGYGIGYFADDHAIGFNVTSYGMDSRKYCETIEESLRDIGKLFE